MMPGRPVACRASLTAASIASAPELPKNDRAPPSNGAIGRDFLREPDLRLVVEIGARHVNEPARLIGNRLDDGRMRMAGRIHGDTGRAVEEPVAVDVFDDAARRVVDDQRIAARVRRRHHRPIAFDERLRFRAGQRGLDVRSFHEV